MPSLLTMEIHENAAGVVTIDFDVDQPRLNNAIGTVESRIWALRRDLDSAFDEALTRSTAIAMMDQVIDELEEEIENHPANPEKGST